MARTQLDVREVYELYIDESSQTKHRFLVLGGIIVEAPLTSSLEEELSLARRPELPAGELGWTKVSRTKLDGYKRFVDVFFNNRYRVRPLEFHSLVVDMHRVRDKDFNQGSREVGFNKEIFQLCTKFARLYPQRFFYTYLDSRQTKSSTEELRLILNRHRAKRGDPRDWPFRRIHFRDSSKLQILQLVDVLLGGIAYRVNGHHLAADASPAKVELSRHILERAGIVNVAIDTPIRGKFTVWHRRLS